MANLFHIFFILLLVEVKHFYCNLTGKLKLVQKHVDLINSLQDSWVAEINSMALLSDAELKGRLGVKGMSLLLPQEIDRRDGEIFGIVNGDKDDQNNIVALPENFDAREQWNHCSSIKNVPDQSNCGSCWAISVASAFSDRICIRTNGTFNRLLSADDLMTCCKNCLPDDQDDGCDGGFPDEAVKFLQSEGICTGGLYNSSDGCKPYPVKPCKSNDCELAEAKVCKSNCTNESYEKSYKYDKYRGKFQKFSMFVTIRPVPNFFGIIKCSRGIPYGFSAGELEELGNDEKKTQKSIMTNGSVTATFMVYNDFTLYKKGVYSRSIHEWLPQGGHAVRVIGWGTENNQQYWLAVNSWGTDWGENGTFKIHRTRHRCQFGDFMTSKTDSNITIY